MTKKIKTTILIFNLLLLFTQCQQTYYNTNLIQTTPFLQISLDSQNLHVCGLGGWDPDIICKQQGFQKDPIIYDIHTTNYNSFGSCPSDDYGLYLDCQSYYADNVNQCKSIEYSYCPDSCVEIICINYRCADQVPGSTDCISCIGSGTGLYERAATTCECQNGKVDKYPAFEDCQDANASDPSNGDLKIETDVLQIFNNWSWKPVLYSSGFDQIAANIACKQMGFNSYKTFQSQTCPVAFEESGEYQFWTQIMSCQGNESKLQSCSRSAFGDAFGSQSDCLNIECVNLPAGDGNIRLDGGVSDKISIVEIQHQNFETSALEWRPICDTSLDRNMAHVICVNSGFKTYKNFWDSQECPNEDQQFWFGRVICTGKEKNLTNCRYPDGWVQTTIKCKCILLQCTNDWEFAEEGSVRISNNSLEYFHNEQWGQVCTKKDVSKIAEVVCNQLLQLTGDKKGYSMSYLKNYAKSQNIEASNTINTNIHCPNYSKFWISDIECKTGKEASLSQCSIDSKFGEHECGVNDCIYNMCGGDITDYFNYKEADVRIEKDIAQIYHNSEWKPISDSGNEYRPTEGYYGQGINKAAAHVFCKQLGNATFQSIEKNQSCGKSFNGYWLGNVMCNGDEINIKECFSLPWGETTTETDDANKCVKIVCEKKRTCTGEHKTTLSSYPYCQCQDGYYDDGLSSDCQKCDSQCKTCIFAADKCVECAVSQAIYGVLDYDRWFQINDDRQSIRILQDCTTYNEDCDTCDNTQCLTCTGDYNPESNCTTVNTQMSCSDNSCCGYDVDCVECDNDTEFVCKKCNPGYDINYDCYQSIPEGGFNSQENQQQEEEEENPNELYGCGSCCGINLDCIRCDGNECLECNPGWSLEYQCSEQEGFNPCTILGENCAECDLNDDQLTGTCNTCGPNWDPATGCMVLLPEHNENAPCVHINSNCIECKGDYCLKCVDGYLEDYNCNVFQYNYCKYISNNCLECDIYTDLCLECKPNYDIHTNCRTLISITSVQAPCMKFSEKCYECTSDQCTKCISTWDPSYNCLVSIPIKTICEASECDNCNGYTCDNTPYVDPNSLNPIAKFEDKVTIKQSSLEYSQNMQTKIVTPEGQMVDINAENIDSLGIFTCVVNCAEGYFMKEDGTCAQCSGKCKVCVENENNCLYCKFEDNPLVGPTPGCACKSGSIINGDDCLECLPGSFAFIPDATECQECPNNAICEGGNHMEVVEGFWRVDKDSYIIVECDNNNENCLGGSNPDTQVQCLEGHKGALCETCDLESDVWDKTYFHSSKYECGECDNNFVVLIILVVTVNLYQISLLLITINGNISAVQDKTKFNSLKVLFNTHKPTPNDTAIIIKILTHFFFSIGIVVSLKISIPYALNMINVSFQMPTIQLSFFMDCYMIDIQQNMPNLYFRIIGQIVYGICQTVAVIVLFKVYVFVKDNLCGCITKHYSGKTRITTLLFAQSVLVYQFLTLQPGIISMILEAVACKDIGGIKYIVSNTYKQCDSDEYQYYTWLLLIPLFIIIGFVITFTILYRIRKISKVKVINAADEQLKQIKKEKRKEKKNKKNQVKPFSEVDQVENLEKEIEELGLDKQNSNEEKEKNKDILKDQEGSDNGKSAEQLRLQDELVEDFINDQTTTNNILKSGEGSPKQLIELTPSNNKIDKKDNDSSSTDSNVDSEIQKDEVKEGDLKDGDKKKGDGKGKDDQKPKISKCQQFQKYIKKIINKENQPVDREQELLKLFPRDSSLEKSGPLTKFGYLYIEYKTIAYYWEFVKIVERILIVAILAFYYDDVKVKGIVVFLIIFFYTALSYTVAPYNLDAHNRLDILASVISAVTLILGVFIYENEYDEWVITSYLIIIFLNLYFISVVVKQFLNKYVENFLNGLTFFLEKKIQITNLIQKIQEFITLSEQGQVSQENQDRIQEITSYFQQLPTITVKQQKELEKLLKTEIPVQLLNQSSQIFNEKKEQLDSIKESVENNQVVLFRKKDYQEFKDQLEVEEKKFKKQIFGTQIITLLLTGSTSSPVTISKANSLKQMIKSYFKNVLVEGYNYGIIQQSFQNKESNALYSSQSQIKKPSQTYAIIDVIEGRITEDQQKSIITEVNELKEEQLKINQQVVSQVAQNYALRLKNLSYPKKLWKKQLNGGQGANDTFLDNDDNDDNNDKEIETSKSQNGNGNANANNQGDQIKMLTQKLTDVDIIQEYESFKLFDKKGESKISIGQIEKNMKKLDQDVPLNDLEYMITHADSEGTGYIDFCQFLALIAFKKDAGQDLEPVKELFSYYNSQQNGEITYLDISLILEQIFDIKETLAVTKEIINILDEKKTSSINFEEFLQLVL